MHNPLYRRLANKLETLEDIEFLGNYRELEAEENTRMSERQYMRRVIDWWLIILTVLAFLVFILNIAGSKASDEARPRYTLTSPNAAFLFSNYENLPFQIINEMCWNDDIGFCDSNLISEATPRELWIVTDWLTDKQGSIYQIGDSCYWWMYQQSYGVDNQPHVDEHYWISCP